MKNKKLIIVLLILLLVILTFEIYYIIKNYFSDRYNEDNTETSEYEDVKKIREYNNPVVPEGFNKVETDTASWELDENGNPKGWNNGLVIEDTIGNQFVWVPVNSIQYEKLLKTYVSKTISNEDRRLLEPVKKYSGFYVARYEAGVSIEMQEGLSNIGPETNDIEGIPVSKKGVRPWNYITKENAKTSAEKMYTNEYIYSGILTYTQWYHINSWLEVSGYDVKDPQKYGNFSNVNFKFNGIYSDDLGVTYKSGNNKNKATINMILATGITDRNMTNNLYDFYGNVSESTILQYTSINPNENVEKRYSVFYAQGGYYDNSSKGADQTFTHGWANSKTGFRVVLYIK